MRPPAVARPGLPVVFTRPEALRAGLTRHVIQQRCATRAWQRLATGVYCRSAAWESGPDEQYRLRAVAASLRWPASAISHASAAALWDLPLPPVRWVAAPPAGPVHRTTWLTLPRGGGSPVRAGGLVVLVADLPERDVVVWRSQRYGRELRVTSTARTLADCLRHLPAAAAVALVDAAGVVGTTRRAVSEVLGRQAAWFGAGRARASLALADPRRESWLESVSAVGLVERGLPLPEPQVQLLTPEGRLVARVDDWWPAHGVVGEADGWAKYRDGGLGSVREAERALRAEKAREDAVRALGVGVVRWSSGEVMTPARMDATAGAVRRALDLAGRWPPRVVTRSTALPPGW